MRDERRAFGELGERLAERTLVERGWRIVERNARTRYGEIDLVCHDGAGYVFVEVKTRRASSFVAAVEAAGPRKMRRLAKLGEAWLALHRARHAAWRLVVVTLTVGTTGADTRLIDVSE